MTKKIFNLPDLGEGLPDATIVEWYVKEGDVIKLDDNLVSMETAKAVVDVPSPVSGTVTKLGGAAGDIVITGHMLAEFEMDMSMPQRADGQDTGHSHGGGHSVGSQDPAPDDRVVASTEGGAIEANKPPPPQPPHPNAAFAAKPPPPQPPGAMAIDPSKPPPPQPPGSMALSAAKPPPPQPPSGKDAGTVVGAMQVGDSVMTQSFVASGGVKALPAVRATARKLGVEIARVRATGPDGVVTMQDVKNAAADASLLLPQQASPAGFQARGDAFVSAATGDAFGAPLSGHLLPQAGEGSRSTLSQSGKPMRTQPPSVQATGQPEQLKGVRRNMARVMADAHAQVVPTTLVDDADLHQWIGKQDITARLVRAIVAACKDVPALNAWFDGKALTRTLHPHVDIGIAVDTEDGLFVSALRNADMLDGNGVRAAIKRLRAQVEDRSIPSSELAGYTISLSNFGMFAGRYATPVVVPPCVAIIGAGKLCHDVVAVMGGIEVHRRMPISLTFDHRACTGGEAARFLKALLDDLARPN